MSETTPSMAATGEARSLGTVAGRRGARLAASLLLAAVVGLVAAGLMPRGPVTTADALTWIAGSLILGLVAGGISATRWAAPVALVGFVLAFELGRWSTDGPTVDGLHPGSTYGLIAIVVGRGISYAFALLPLVLGVLLGVDASARLGGGTSGKLGRIGWLLVAVLAVALIAVYLVLLRPASTAAIVGADGAAVSDSIAELTSVELGGHEQALMIRGRNVDAPVLLHLAGGPGGTDLGAMRGDTSLEADFVVVTWDQRGTGKSYDALDPDETLTLEQMVADTIELSEYLRDRFDEERIYVHGNSWGSTLGVLAAQQRPDLFHAFVGSGQMVSQRETDVMFWEDTMAWAESVGDDALVEQLRASGPPPYEDILDYEAALSHEHDWNPYPEWDGEKELPFTLFVPENTFMDQVNGLRAFLDTFSVLYPRLQAIDFRQDVPRLEVPVYVVTGAHEARGRAVMAEEWFARLQAPAKEWVVFEHSGHRPSFEEPGLFAQLMRRVHEETGARSTALLVP